MQARLLSGGLVEVDFARGADFLGAHGGVRATCQRLGNAPYKAQKRGRAPCSAVASRGSSSFPGYPAVPRRQVDMRR